MALLGAVTSNGTLYSLNTTGGVPPLEFRAERVGGAGVGDVELRAVRPADDHHLPAVNRCLLDLRPMRAVAEPGGPLGDGEFLECLRGVLEPPAGVLAKIGLDVAIAADDPEPGMPAGPRVHDRDDGRAALQAVVEMSVQVRPHDVDAL